jgi:hypothetical protein
MFDPLTDVQQSSRSDDVDLPPEVHADSGPVTEGSNTSTGQRRVRDDNEPQVTGDNDSSSEESGEHEAPSALFLRNLTASPTNANEADLRAQFGDPSHTTALDPAAIERTQDPVAARLAQEEGYKRLFTEIAKGFTTGSEIGEPARHQPQPTGAELGEREGNSQWIAIGEPVKQQSRGVLRRKRPPPDRQVKNELYQSKLLRGPERLITSKTAFVVPSNKLPDRLSQPIGTNTHRAQPRNQLLRAPLRQIAEAVGLGALGSGGVGETAGSAGAVVSESGYGVLGAQRLGVGLFSAFNFVTAKSNQTRYTEQLASMLATDITNFKANPRIDTLILTRDSKGKFQYDIDKVANLAASDNPELAAESLHAKNVLLTNHIANDISSKHQGRAMYEFLRSSVGIAGAVTAIVATHGAAGGAMVGKAAAARAVGYGLAGASSVNPARDIRYFKQGMRLEKAALIESAEVLKRYQFAQQTKEGFKDPEVRFTDPKTKKLEVFPARTVAANDVPDKAIDGVHGSLRDQATRQVNSKNVFGGIFPGQWINEKKTYDAKKDRRDFVGAHAAMVIAHNLGVGDPKNVPRFVEILSDFDKAEGSKQDEVIDKAVNEDIGMKTAYQLIRDMGGGKSESLQVIRQAMETAIREHLASDQTTARLSGTQGYKLEEGLKKSSKRMGTDMSRRR